VDLLPGEASDGRAAVGASGAPRARIAAADDDEAAAGGGGNVWGDGEGGREREERSGSSIEENGSETNPQVILSPHDYFCGFPVVPLDQRPRAGTITPNHFRALGKTAPSRHVLLLLFLEAGINRVHE